MAYNELKEQADQLKDAVDGATGDMMDKLDECGGADLLLTLGHMAVGAVRNRADQWRVREVAALCASRVLVFPATPDELADRMLQELTSCGAFEHKQPVKEAQRAWQGTLAQQQNELLCPGRSPKEQAAAKAQMEKEAFIAQQNEIASIVDAKTALVQRLQDEIDSTSDPLAKQRLIVQCREEQFALAQAAKNIESVSKKLDVVVDFLAGMQKSLAAISSKLDAMQDAVAAVQASVQRLTGKPPLEVIAAVDRVITDEMRQLPRFVFVPPNAVDRGPIDIAVESLDYA